MDTEARLAVILGRIENTASDLRGLKSLAYDSDETLADAIEASEDDADRCAASIRAAIALAVASLSSRGL